MVGFASVYLFFINKNSLWGRLNIRKADLNVNKRNTRYGGLLLLHLGVNLTIKVRKKVVRREEGALMITNSNHAYLVKKLGC